MSTLAVDSIALPLDQQQTDRLQRAVDGLTAAQLQWVSGYVAGLAANGAAAAAPAVAAAPGESFTILYGSQTGNGQAVAQNLAGKAEAAGFAVRLQSLADYKPSQLKRERQVALVVSTHGDGDPPDDAELFHEFVLSKKSGKLAGLRYSVLALGDSSYVNFCQTGRELDAALAELGAERIADIVECDLDYDEPAGAWVDGLVASLPELLEASAPVPQLRAVATTPRFDKRNPYRAEVLVNQKITGAGSTKDVRHIELSIADSGLHYAPGDALAVVVDNPPQLVAQFMGELGFDPATEVEVAGDRVTLGEALGSKLEITTTSLGFLRYWAGLSRSGELSELLQPANKEALTDFVDTHQVIDVVRKYPASPGAAEFAASLRRLGPRSYSIASSLDANPDEVHLTVAAVHYEAHGSEHWGAGSTYLVDRVDEGGTVAVFVEPNPRFRLPADDTPIIMIGPGTGVAPFRAFVEERAGRGASGDNWLFFGDRNFSSDFLYQLEWQRHLKAGHLARLDVAFSRDRDEKVYVQHRIRENAADVFEWLERGAVIYVCGDAGRMAPDVDAALADVLVGQGGLSPADAADRLKAMRRDGRYQRDVY